MMWSNAKFRMQGLVFHGILVLTDHNTNGKINYWDFKHCLKINKNWKQQVFDLPT